MRITAWMLAGIAGMALGAQEPEKNLFFKMDFDSPVKIGSETLDVSLPAEGFTEGKFGKGFYFQRPSRNFLPENIAVPEDKSAFSAKNNAALSFENDGPDKVLGVTNGGFSIRETPVTLADGKLLFTRPTTAVTGSCYVKGPKGAKVEFSVSILPESFPEKETKALCAKYLNNKLVVPDPAFAEKFRPEIVHGVTVVLTGEWQRIATFAECDVRSAKSRRAIMEASVPGEGKVLFKKFQLEHSLFYPYNTSHPTSWLPGKTARAAGETGLCLTLDAIRSRFPGKEGSLGFWFRTPSESNMPAGAGGFFCFGETWRKPMWVVDNGRIEVGCAPAQYLPKPGFDCPQWTHFALTWNEKETVCYINGEKKRSAPRNFEDFPTGKYLFCVGKNLWSERSANAVMDEFLIFDRALTAPEIEALSKAESTLGKGEDSGFRVAPFSVKPFYRNDPGAGITLEVSSKKAQTVRLVFDSFTKQAMDVPLRPGWNTVKIPVHPELKAPGEGSWTLKIADSAGKTLYATSGKYKVEGQLRRDLVRFLSWGGEGEVPLEYERKLGISARNVPPAMTGAALQSGMMISLDLRNHGRLPQNGFDVEKTVRESREGIRDLRDSFLWYGTLLNSEAAGKWRFTTWKQYPKLFEQAQKALGFQPPVDLVRINPDMCLLPDPEIRFDSDGVFVPGKAFRLLEWYRARGDILYTLNGETGKMVKSIAPDNLTWTEPAHPGLFRDVDMGSDWSYDVTLQEIAGRFRNGYAHAQCHQKFFQPTLAMYYWINSHEPAMLDGKKYFLPRSVDELSAACWVAAGMTPFHDLSFFNTYAWYDSETAAKMYLPMKGMADAFGRFMKESFTPAALLLRDTDEPRARVALVVPEQISFYSEKDWNYYRVKTMWLRTLSFHNIFFDVLYDANLKEKSLADYRTLIVPMRSKCSRGIHEQLLAASKTAEIVTDAYCPVSYPNMKKLAYSWKTYEQEDFQPCEDFIRLLARQNTGRTLRAAGEKGAVLYFERLYKGRRYFIVVNNLWTTGYLSECSVKKRIRGLDYKPYGVPQKVKVFFTPEPGRGTVVYDFLKSSELPLEKNGSDFSFEVNLGPGEGRLFCVYPEKFVSLKSAAGKTFRPGTTGPLHVELKTADGRSPGGRQLLEVKVTDGKGNPADESGWYVMENGSAHIPIRIALDSAPGEWKTEVMEKTTGFRTETSFSVPR